MNNWILFSSLCLMFFVLGYLFHQNNQRIPPGRPPLLSPFIVDTVGPAGGHVPSYINPVHYRIRYFRGRYIAEFPGGTVLDDFDSHEGAQKAINRAAAESKERWERYGGF